MESHRADLNPVSVAGPAKSMSPSTTSDIIDIQVGERRFTTLKDTLTDGSGYFEALFSGRWAAPSRTDGSYFLDADGDVFAHVLHYLRHRLFPLLYDRSKGFDYKTYSAISKLAEFLVIEPLVEWIDKHSFHKAITITRRGLERDDTLPFTETTNSNESHSFYPSWQRVKVYVCPREIVVHRGDKRKCGRACLTAQGDDEDRYEVEQTLKMVEMVEVTNFDHKICSEA